MHVCEFFNAYYLLWSNHILIHDYQILWELTWHLEFNSVAFRMESQVPALILYLKALMGLLVAKYKSSIEEATK